MKIKKGLTVLLHIIGWALFLALPFFLRPNPNNFQHRHPSLIENINPLYFPLITNALVLPFFYLNLFVFFPKYIPNKKYGQFVIVQIIFLTLIYFIKDAVFRLMSPGWSINRPYPEIRDFFFVFVYLFVTLLAFSYGMIRENIRKERIQQEKEHESMKSELQFLRWQVNPHFLFNALNNIVSLARIKSDKLEPILIKLSTLMRYMLYETSEFRIPINKEIEYLQSYIDLQRLRVGPNIDIRSDFNVANDCQYTIEPMLLIPVIENAFKHGIGLIESPVIDIHMSMKGSLLEFTVKNKYVSNAAKNHDDTSGIGLTNLKRRLELLYKDKYKLDIESGEYFIVSLKIDIG